jgi:hypothetical protein
MHRRADGGNVGVAVRVLVVVSTATPTCARRDPMDERGVLTDAPGEHQRVQPANCGSHRRDLPVQLVD